MSETEHTCLCKVNGDGTYIPKCVFCGGIVEESDIKAPARLGRGIAFVTDKACPCVSPKQRAAALMTLALL